MTHTILIKICQIILNQTSKAAPKVSCKEGKISRILESHRKIVYSLCENSALNPFPVTVLSELNLIIISFDSDSMVVGISIDPQNRSFTEPALISK